MIHQLISGILCATEVEIEQILTAVSQRYSELFPDWEISILTLHKETDRDQQLDRVISLLENMKHRNPVPPISAPPGGS